VLSGAPTMFMRWSEGGENQVPCSTSNASFAPMGSGHGLAKQVAG
jgi:hypothetical protein